MIAFSRRLSVAAALALAFSVMAVPTASAAHVTCGTVITQDTTLDSNVGPCADGGVTIATDNVTLDLNGFTIFGVAGVPGDGVGVLVDGRTGVTVTNGTVRDFDGGIALEGGSGNTVSKVKALNNVGSGLISDYGDGIALNGSNNNTVIDSQASGNGPYDGIGMFNGSSGNLIKRNLVTDNNLPNTAAPPVGHHSGGTVEDDGIRVEPNSNNNSIINNTVLRNGLDGIALFPRTSGNKVNDNVVEGNGFHDVTHRKGDGIRLFGGSSTVPGSSNNFVENNAVRNNAAHGIFVGNFAVTNKILTNMTGANVVWDLFDGNSNCDQNVWLGNTFDKAFPACTTG